LTFHDAVPNARREDAWARDARPRASTRARRRCRDASQVQGLIPPLSCRVKKAGSSSRQQSHPGMMSSLMSGPTRLTCPSSKPRGARLSREPALRTRPPAPGIYSAVVRVPSVDTERARPGTRAGTRERTRGRRQRHLFWTRARVGRFPGLGTRVRGGRDGGFGTRDDVSGSTAPDVHGLDRELPVEPRARPGRGAPTARLSPSFIFEGRPRVGPRRAVPTPSQTRVAHLRLPSSRQMTMCCCVSPRAADSPGSRDSSLDGNGERERFNSGTPFLHRQLPDDYRPAGYKAPPMPSPLTQQTPDDGTPLSGGDTPRSTPGSSSDGDDGDGLESSLLSNKSTGGLSNESSLLSNKSTSKRRSDSTHSGATDHRDVFVGTCEERGGRSRGDERRR